MMPPPSRRPSRRSGFTLIELLLVIGVITLLTAAFGAAAGIYLPKVKIRKAAQQISLICSAMEAYGAQTWLKQAYTPQQRSWSLWDMDANNILDGTTLDAPPPRDGANDSDAAKLPYAYRGFLEHTRFRYNPKDVNDRGELIDPWSQPYRVAMRFNEAQKGSLAAWQARFGGGRSGDNIWYAVWSLGPDGVDGSKDDIVSWRTND